MMMMISKMTLSKHRGGPLERAAMDVSITEGDARSVLRAATRSLIADIVTMKLRTIRSVTRLTDTLWRRSSVPCASTSKMFNKFAKTVVCAWASSFARSASSLTMIPQSSSIIATNAVSAELEGVRTFSTVIVVAAATQLNYVRDTPALKSLCTKTVQFAWSTCSIP